MEGRKSVFSRPNTDWETNNISENKDSSPQGNEESLSVAGFWSKKKEGEVGVFVPKEWEFIQVKPEAIKKETPVIEEKKEPEQKITPENALIPPESVLELMDQRAIVPKWKGYVYVKKDGSFITLRVEDEGSILLLPKNRKKKPFYKKIRYHYYLHVNSTEMEDIDISMNNRRIGGTYAWKKFWEKYGKDNDIDTNLIRDTYIFEIIFKKKKWERKMRVKWTMPTIEKYAMALVAYYGYEGIESITAINFEKDFWQSLFIKKSSKTQMSPKDLFLFTRKLGKKYKTNPSGAETTHLREMIHELDAWAARNVAIYLVEHMEKNNKPLADVLSKSPENFDVVYQSVIKIWHLNGKLAEAFERLADITERQYQLGRVVKKSLRTPTVAFVLLVTVITLSVKIALPIIEDIYATFNAELPPLTITLKTIVNLLFDYWYACLVVWMASIATYSFWANNTLYGRKFMADLRLTIPLLGEFSKKRDFEVFTAIAALIYSQWDDIAIILNKLKRVVQNFHISWVINTAAINWQEMKAYPWATFAKYDQYIDPKIANAWKTAYSPVVEYETLTNIYRGENDDFIDSLKELLWPLLMALIALWILIIIFGIVYPLYNIVNIIN